MQTEGHIFMNKSKWIILAVVFMLTALARAETVKQTIHEDWYRCQQASQCVVVKGNCDVEWAANKDFADQSRKDPPRLDEPCTKPLESHPANTVAICESNKCALSPPGFYAGSNRVLLK